MRYHFLLFFIWTSFLFSCRRDNQPPTSIECAIPAVVPYQPYSSPVWHPNGNLLGFNHTPLAGVSTNGTAPCIWYMNSAKSDSTGFYLMNKDGSSVRQITNFTLSAPAWSPDGNWIAFSLGANIYKMPFNGSTFDTTRIIQLTTVGGNFYPSWTPNSDTIYFDSNNDAPVGTSFYCIWKMANDGSGKTRITQSAGIGDTRQPFVGSDNKVYHIGYSASQPEIFSMNKDGSNRVQLTFNGKNGARRSPKYYQGKVFFWDGRLFSTSVMTFMPQEVSKSNETFDISQAGEIIYPSSEYGILDRRFGTLWIMNTDGSNKRQLTFNHY